MAASTDWQTIENLWRAGVNNAEIARRVGGISKEGIRRRALKEAWRRDGDNPEPEPERRDWLAEIPDYAPLDEFDRPEVRATVLAFLDSGAPIELAADYAGVELERLDTWFAADTDFAEQARTARADALLHELKKLKSNKDGRLALDVLARRPDTKKYYAQPTERAATAVQVNLNMPRPGSDGAVLVDGKRID